MNAHERLLTQEEMVLALRNISAPGGIGGLRDQTIARRQVRKTLEALRPIVEYAAKRECRSLQKRWSEPYCGHCATCRARELLAEMDKGKEG